LAWHKYPNLAVTWLKQQKWQNTGSNLSNILKISKLLVFKWTIKYIRWHFFITLRPLICGCDGLVAIKKFANVKHSWFKQHLPTENVYSISCYIETYFFLIDPEQFQTCFSLSIMEIVKMLPGIWLLLTENVFDDHMIINWHLDKWKLMINRIKYPLTFLFKTETSEAV